MGLRGGRARLLAAALLAHASTHAAEPAVTPPPPTLMVLEMGEAGNARVLEIPVTPGAGTPPVKELRARRWALRAGAAVAAGRQPPDRMVELVSGSAQQPALICKIAIRYFRGANRLWIAHFQLIEEPLVARHGERWVPITTLAGAQNLIVLTSSTLPNAEGYYPALEFGFSSESPPLGFWVVH